MRFVISTVQIAVGTLFLIPFHIPPCRSAQNRLLNSYLVKQAAAEAHKYHTGPIPKSQNLPDAAV